MGLAVSVAGVHGDVLDVALVRQEANRGTVKPSSLILGMGQQSATEAPPLLLGRDGDVLDPQLIVVRHEFDDTRERSAGVEDPHLVLHDGLRIVDEHGHRRPADQRDVLPVRGRHQVADRVSVVRSGATEDRGWRRCAWHSAMLAGRRLRRGGDTAEMLRRSRGGQT